jgi:hypothetical protein
MNIGESDHIAADLGIPTWTQNQKLSDNNRRERLSIQIMQGENFGLDVLSYQPTKWVTLGLGPSSWRVAWPRYARRCCLPHEKTWISGLRPP